MKKILFIGLGRMGAPMAGHLAANDTFAVSVHNRSASKTEQWLKQHAGTAHARENCYDAIVLCVGNDDDVRENLSVDGQFLPCLKPSGVIVDHTTTSAALAQEMSASLLERDIHYLDAPVSGGEAGAINAALSCMLGGDNNAVQDVADILSCYCANVVHIGASGAGQISKMANQLCIAGILAGLSEAICMVEKAGVNAENVYRAIKGGAAQSWQLDNRFQTMIASEYDFGFAIEHMIKDLRYALAEADSQGWTPAIANKVIGDYQHLLEDGYAGMDTSVLVEKYRRDAKNT